jgi:hypothetical protein
MPKYPVFVQSQAPLRNELRIIETIQEDIVSSLNSGDLLAKINKLLKTNYTSVTPAILAEYLSRHTQITTDHSDFLNTSVVSKEEFRNLTSIYKEFKSIEFNLPVTPAPPANLFTVVDVSNGYIQVRDENQLTTNALVSMFNSGVINNSFSLDFINAPNDNGFVVNVDNTLVGANALSSATRTANDHLMSVQKVTDFAMQMKFSFADKDQLTHFFMYDLAPAVSSNAQQPYEYKYLDINSALSTNPYVPAHSTNPMSVVATDTSVLTPGTFYTVNLVKTGGIVNFTITDENGNFKGSATDSTASINGAYFGFLNNSNVTFRSIVLSGVTFNYLDGNPFSEINTYKIQASLDSDLFIASVSGSASYWEIIEVIGPSISSKLKIRDGDGAEFHIDEEIKFVYSKTSLGVDLIYDVYGLRQRSDGLLMSIDELSLNTVLEGISPAADTTTSAIVHDLTSHTDSTANSTYVNLRGVKYDELVTPAKPINPFNIKLTINTAAPDSNSTFIYSVDTFSNFHLPQGFKFEVDNIQSPIIQYPRNSITTANSTYGIDKDSIIFTLVGNYNAAGATTETHIFIFKDNVLIGSIPVKDKSGSKAINRSYVSPTGLQSNYSEVILMGSQLAVDSGYYYLCYGVDAKGAPFTEPYNNIVRSENYQRLVKIDLGALSTSATPSANDVILATGGKGLTYFTEGDTNAQLDYISPISMFPYGQHINIGSSPGPAMIAINRQNYFENSLYVYKLDLGNNTFIHKVIYENPKGENDPAFSDMGGVFRGAISKDYVGISVGTSVQLLKLSNSFESGAASVNPPVKYFQNTTVDQAGAFRVSTLDAYDVPYWFGFDKIVKYEDAIAAPATTTTLVSTAIVPAIDGSLTVSGQPGIYQYDYDTDKYVLSTDTGVYYTVSVETGTLAWNTNITVPSSFKVMVDQHNIKWLAFRSLTPAWVYKAISIVTTNSYTSGTFANLSREEQVPGNPTLVYLSLFQVLWVTIQLFGRGDYSDTFAFGVTVNSPA